MWSLAFCIALVALRLCIGISLKSPCGRRGAVGLSFSERFRREAKAGRGLSDENGSPRLPFLDAKNQHDGEAEPPHNQHKKTRHLAMPGFYSTLKAGDQPVTFSSSVTAFIDRRMRPCLSTSRTLTLTRSPSLSLSETFSTRSLEICDT